jgi:hypothetical protein
MTLLIDIFVNILIILLLHVCWRKVKVKESKDLSYFAYSYAVHLELVWEHVEDSLLVHGVLVGPEVVEPLDHPVLQLSAHTSES